MSKYYLLSLEFTSKGDYCFSWVKLDNGKVKGALFLNTATLFDDPQMYPDCICIERNILHKISKVKLFNYFDTVMQCTLVENTPENRDLLNINLDMLKGKFCADKSMFIEIEKYEVYQCPVCESVYYTTNKENRHNLSCCGLEIME